MEVSSLKPTSAFTFGHSAVKMSHLDNDIDMDVDIDIDLGSMDADEPYEGVSHASIV